MYTHIQYIDFQVEICVNWQQITDNSILVIIATSQGLSVRGFKLYNSIEINLTLATK